MYYGFTAIASWWRSTMMPGMYLVNPRDLEAECYYAVMDDFGDLVEV